DGVLRSTPDQRTRSRGGPWKIGSANGSDLGTALPRTAESPFGQPSVTGAGGSIYVPELSWLGSDELAGCGRSVRVKSATLRDFRVCWATPQVLNQGVSAL